MGNNIGRIANNIQLGNLEVLNFLDYYVNRDSVDIKNYTKKRNFLIENLKVNFEKNGNTFARRYSMDEIAPTGSYRIKPNSDGEGVEGFLTQPQGDLIGDFYGIDYRKNSSLQFITPEVFLKFNKQIRGLLIDNKQLNTLNYVGAEKTKDSKPTSYAMNFIPENSGINNNDIVKTMSYGDIYTVEEEAKTTVSYGDIYAFGEKARTYHSNLNTLVANTKAITSGYSELNPYKGINSSYTYLNTDDMFDVKARGYKILMNLYDSAHKSRVNLSSYVKNSDEIISIGYYSVNDKLYRIKENIFKKTLLGYYTEEKRLEISNSMNKGIKYPSHNGSTNSPLYKSSAPYAIEGSDEEVKIYNIDDENTFEKSTISKNIGENSKLLAYTKNKITSILSNIQRNDIYEVKEKNNIRYNSALQYSFKNRQNTDFRKRDDIANIQRYYGGLRPNNGAERLNDNSVLQRNGLVKIAPSINDKTNLKDAIKKCMFSIENLAWKDTTGCLSSEQKGPNGGRIMWFPPYNLKFSENVNVNWNENNFIGRGEGIYTYANTSRSGTLDFTLLIDHPSSINKWMGAGKSKSDNENEEIIAYFYGSRNFGLSDNTSTTSSTQEESSEGSIDPAPTSQSKKYYFFTFFPKFIADNRLLKEGVNFEEFMIKFNNKEEIKIEDCVSENFKQYFDAGIQSYGAKGEESVIRNVFQFEEDSKIYGLNDLIKINDFIKNDEIFGNKNCTISKITINEGYGESELSQDNNSGEIISNSNRAEFVEGYVKDSNLSSSIDGIVVGRQESALLSKMSCYAYVCVEVTWNDTLKPSDTPVEDATSTTNNENVDGVEVSDEASASNENMVTIVEYNDSEFTYDNEYLYFAEAVKHGEFQKTIDYVKYFNPAFHSITPEGFNSRLTFLHQCTRQGPTNAVSSGNLTQDSPNYLKFAGNLSFGRAPYCVLRIGDFFNTKICIDSISISYDNSGVQWDLNPEGAGVQPMFANISISFKFIGGQDISGPIARLQNAVTANYYANASIYSRHADTESNYFDAVKGGYVGK